MMFPVYLAMMMMMIDDDDDDEAIINKEEISNSLRSRAMKAYTSTKSFRPSFNPPKGLSVDQGRRSRRA